MNISRLVDLMKKNKITQKELADIAGVTRPTIGNLINSGDFRVMQIEKIAKFLQVPVSYFFDDVVSGISIQNVGNGTGNVSILNSENERLKVELNGLKREIAYLKDKVKDKEEIIEVLKSK